jgi:hypothetical protein
MVEQLHTTLTGDEQILWADRPQMDMMMWEAERARKLGMIIGFGVGSAIIVLGIVLAIFTSAHILPPIICTLFGGLFIALGVYTMGIPERTRRAGPKRACYALTNRRLILHPGTAAQTVLPSAFVRPTGKQDTGPTRKGFGGRAGGNWSRSESSTTDTDAQEAISSDVMALMRSRPDKPRIFTYAGLELAGMTRKMSAAFEGCGVLFFRRDKYDRPDGIGLWALKDICNVERTIRQQLLDPLIEKQLRGEKLTQEEQGARLEERTPEGEESEDIPPDENIKDFVRSGKAKAAEAKDPNQKTHQSEVAHSVENAPEELRQEVEAELTEGEQVLWIGVPEGKVKGRGMMGALKGAAIRYEPDYYLYAITNRRALLFCEKGSTDSQGAVFGGSKDTQGPVSYYPGQLQQCGLETDERLPDGGGIVFKREKRIIQTTTTTESSHTETHKGFRGHRGSKVTTKTSSTSVSTRVENHHFGILRIRNYVPVARLLAETLILPVRA